MGGFLVVVSISVLFFTHPRLTLAQEGASFRLNEVMANPAQGPEWVELYNPSDQEIDLSGWRLDDEEGGSPPLNLEGRLKPGGYLLVETGRRLNNGGDEVRLISPGGGVVDSFVYTSTTNGFSFAREPGGVWTETGRASPGRANQEETPPTARPSPSASASAKPILSPAPIVSPSASPSPTLTPTPVSGGFDPVLSEFAPNPTEGNEWIELYNPYPAPLAVSGWRLDDEENGGARPVQMSGVIEPRGYLVVAFGTRLNNSGDVVRLIRPDKSEAERFEFAASQPGEVWAKDFNGRWRQTQKETPGAANIIDWPPLTPAPSPTPGQTSTPTPPPFSSPAPVSTPSVSSPVYELGVKGSPPPVRLAELGLPWYAEEAVLGAADGSPEGDLSSLSQAHRPGGAVFFIIGGGILGAAGLILIEREDMIRCSRAIVGALASRCRLVVVDFLPFEHPENFTGGESGA